MLLENNFKKLSIIVPIYNTQAFLPDCIESILGQTYKNFELLLVDDGSTDNSLEICKSYAEKDGRIKVFHKENGGQGSARNLGLDNATGDYVGFIDSDDLITQDMYEFLVELIENTGSDVAICEKTTFIEKSEINVDNSKSDEVLIMTAFEAIEHRMTDGKYVNDGPCNKLYRKSVFKELRFIEDRILEDTATTYKILDLSKKVAYTNKTGYLIRINPNSVSRMNYKVRRCDTIMSFEEMVEFFSSREEYQVFVPQAKLFANGAVFYNAGEFYLNKINDDKTKLLIKSHAKKQLKEYKKTKFKNKILLWLIANAFCIYGLFYKLSKRG